MLKFFRKYNKWILVIGGGLLMIAFLVPQALQQVGQAAAGRAYAKFDGGEISLQDAQFAAGELRLLTDMLGLDPQSLGIEDEEHWILLVAEARRAGYAGGVSDSLALLDRLAREYAQQFVMQAGGQISIDQAYAQVRSELEQRRMQLSGGGVSSTLDRALANLFGVQRLRAAYLGAPKLSSARALRFAESVLDTARVQAAIVPADALASQVPAPSTAELEAQFAKHRDVDPGAESGNEYGFGYRLPIGVKVEWITIDPQAFLDTITLDPIDVRKRFEANRDAYPGEFSAERARVRDDLARERVKALMQEADQVVRAAGLADVRDIPTDGRGFRTLPGNWRESRTELTAIADQVVQRFRTQHNLTLPHPFVGVEADAWLSPAEFAQLPGIGQSFIQDGLRVFALSQVLGEIRELQTSDETTARFQVGVLNMPSADSADQRHYFRFLDVRPAGPPASIDEVRAQVERDLRRLSAFEVMKERAEGLRDTLVARGPDAAAQMLQPGARSTMLSVSDEQAVPLFEPMASETLQRTLAQRSFRDAVMGAARALTPTEPIDLQPMDSRVLIVPVREALSVAFVRITARDPLTREEYESLQSRIVLAAMQRELNTSEDNPFSLENLRQRLNYREVGRRASRENADNADAGS